MSMFQGLAQATQPAGFGAADVLLLVMLAASIGAAIAARVLPPRLPIRPDRIPPGRPAWMLVGAVLLGIGAYFFVLTLYLAIKYPPSAQHAAPRTAEQYTAADNAFMSVVPPLVGFAVMLAGDWVARSTTRQDLGMQPARLPGGCIAGLLGALIVVPPLFFAEIGLEQTYHAIHYQHEAEHPLLHLLRAKPSPGIVAAIVVGACVVAPLVEELLFRGHIQTLIRRMFYRWTIPAVPDASEFPIANVDVPPLAKPVEPPMPKPWQTWLAIVITSLLFASLHPAWTAPIIFLLSVCLGYAYERTGNLWVSITIHAAFNGVSTGIFLWGLYTGG